MFHFTAEDFEQLEKEKKNGKRAFTIFDKKKVNDKVGMGELYNTQRRESYKCTTVKALGLLEKPIDDYHKVLPNYKRSENVKKTTWDDGHLKTGFMWISSLDDKINGNFLISSRHACWF